MYRKNRKQCGNPEPSDANSENSNSEWESELVDDCENIENSSIVLVDDSEDSVEHEVAVGEEGNDSIKHL